VFVSRRNPDGSPWQPGTSDCVCSDHFISGSKLHLPSSSDFVLSIQRKDLEISSSEDSYCRFERTRCHARIREQASKELEKNKQEAELEQAQINNIQCCIIHNHTYASSKEELVSLEVLNNESRMKTRSWVKHHWERVKKLVFQFEFY